MHCAHSHFATECIDRLTWHTGCMNSCHEPSVSVISGALLSANPTSQFMDLRLLPATSSVLIAWWVPMCSADKSASARCQRRQVWPWAWWAETCSVDKTSGHKDGRWAVGRERRCRGRSDGVTIHPMSANPVFAWRENTNTHMKTDARAGNRRKKAPAETHASRRWPCPMAAAGSPLRAPAAL